MSSAQPRCATLPAVLSQTASTHGGWMGDVMQAVRLVVVPAATRAGRAATTRSGFDAPTACEDSQHRFHRYQSRDLHQIHRPVRSHGAI